MVDPDQAAERDADCGARSSCQIMDDAPWVPVFNEQRFTMRSDAPRRRRRPVRRSGAHPRQLRLRVRERCTITTKPHHPSARIITSAGTIRLPRSRRWRRARRSTSSASTAAAAISSANSTVADVGTLDFAKVNPVTGPIFIDGAEPGDAVKITIDEFEPSGFGWTAIIPGFGLLADQFTDPGADALDLRSGLAWRRRRSRARPRCRSSPSPEPSAWRPAEKGLHSVVPPRRVGGNLDVRDIGGGLDALPAGRGRGGAVLDRRHPRRPGRRRGLRHGHRKRR